MHLVSFDELDPIDAALVAMDEVLRRVGAALADKVVP